ncbi:MAG TPA: hypothetical protein VEB86_15570, partial [Chryseosolibacter sp.]|nr:hypothetical protein [Chryseosolibacter sp.]
MMKGIKISTKITLLIVLLGMVAVSAIGLFTYDLVIKARQEKFTTNLRVVAENRAAYLDHYLDKFVAGIKVLQESETLKTGGVDAAATPQVIPVSDFATEGATETEGTSEETEVVSDSPAASPLEDYLKFQKGVYGFEEIFLTTPTGSIVASTNGKSGNLLDPDGISFDQGQKGIYMSMITPESGNFTTFFVAPVNSNSGMQLLLAKVKLDGVFSLLKDSSGVGQTGEVILVQHNPVVRNFSFVSPLKSDVTLTPFRFEDKVVSSVRHALENKIS